MLSDGSVYVTLILLVMAGHAQVATGIINSQQPGIAATMNVMAGSALDATIEQERVERGTAQLNRRGGRRIVQFRVHAIRVRDRHGVVIPQVSIDHACPTVDEGHRR